MRVLKRAFDIPIAVLGAVVPLFLPLFLLRLPGERRRRRQSTALIITTIITTLTFSRRGFPLFYAQFHPMHRNVDLSDVSVSLLDAHMEHNAFPWLHSCPLKGPTKMVLTWLQNASRVLGEKLISMILLGGSPLFFSTSFQTYIMEGTSAFVPRSS